MDILLVDRDTIFNNIVKKKTNSPWGHSSVVIDDVVYDFDYNGRNKSAIEDIISHPDVYRATLFSVEMPDRTWEAEEMYKALFSISDYDIKVAYELKNKFPVGRNLENIQSGPGLYTCSNLIAKVIHEIYEDIGLIPELLKDIHWSQIAPADYSKLDFKKELI
jgi:hypothetical protein